MVVPHPEFFRRLVRMHVMHNYICMHGMMFVCIIVSNYYELLQYFVYKVIHACIFVCYRLCLNLNLNLKILLQEVFIYASEDV